VRKKRFERTVFWRLDNLYGPYLSEFTNAEMRLANCSGSSIGLRCPLPLIIPKRAFGMWVRTSRLCRSIESTWSSSSASSTVGTLTFATSHRRFTKAGQAVVDSLVQISREGG
jgi:hypothetical protein